MMFGLYLYEALNYKPNSSQFTDNWENGDFVKSALPNRVLKFLAQLRFGFYT